MNVQVNGVILYYEKQGSGPPLVLLHGKLGISVISGNAESLVL